MVEVGEVVEHEESAEFDAVDWLCAARAAEASFEVEDAEGGVGHGLVMVWLMVWSCVDGVCDGIG